MRRPLLLLVLAGVLMAMLAPAAAGGGPPSTSPIQGKWERLAPDDDVPDPELATHEVRVFRHTGDEWVSTFKLQNDPRLGEPQPISDTIGDFRGVETDPATVDCGEYGCLVSDITYALQGVSTFGLRGEDPFRVPTVFATTETGMAWWIGEFDFRPSFPYYEVFACPWYSKFDEALSANPAFDLDCIVQGEFDGQGFENIPVEQNCTDGYDNDGDGHVDSEDPDCLS